MASLKLSHFFKDYSWIYVVTILFVPPTRNAVEPRYGNINKASVVEKVTDILSSFCEEKSLLALQKMKEFQDVVSRGWEGQILKKIGDMEILK